MKYYFIGIKGTGMSSLALFLKEKGFEVAGADTDDYIFTEEQLKKCNIKIDDLEHLNYENYDVVVLGNNFSNMQIEDKKTITYPKMLNNIMKDYISIGVCGTHGKTSTSNNLAYLLNSDYIIGNGTSCCKNSPYFVFEACEYKRVFLNYEPDYLIITNVDYDHVDYYKTKKDYNQAFLEFISQVKKQVIVNGDDHFLKQLPKTNNTIKYGLGKNNDIRAINIKYSKEGTSFDLVIRGKYYKTFNLKIYGKHNLYNILACISCAYLLEKKIDIVDLPITKRRFNEYYYKSNVFIDDYGHHPNEIKATLEAIRQKYPNRRIALIFQPDRYSRIQKFASDFISAFSFADESYILPFPKCSLKEKGIDITDNYLATLDNSIIFIDKDFSSFKNYQNYIFLMSSSKNVNTIKEEIIREMKNNVN